MDEDQVDGDQDINLDWEIDLDWDRNLDIHMDLDEEMEVDEVEKTEDKVIKIEDVPMMNAAPPKNSYDALIEAYLFYQETGHVLIRDAREDVYDHRREVIFKSLRERNIEEPDSSNPGNSEDHFKKMLGDFDIFNKDKNSKFMRLWEATFPRYGSGNE